MIATCGVLFVVAFLRPAGSRRPELKLDRALGKGQRAGAKVDAKRPATFGRAFEKPFEKARSAVAKSAALGRKARTRVPI